MARTYPSRDVQTKGWRHSSVAVSLLAEMAERRKAVGQRVVTLREKRRWSQEELATAAKLSVKTISRLENGRYESRRLTIDRVADALGVNADDLDPAPAGPLGLGENGAEPDAAMVPASELQAIRADLAGIREDMAQITDLMQQLLDPLAGLLSAQEAVAQHTAEPAPRRAAPKQRQGGRRKAS